MTTARPAERYLGPVPVPQQESDFYWEKCKQHELWLRYCNHCSKAYFYPRDICPNCFSRKTTWVKASGKGILYTFAIVHQAQVSMARATSQEAPKPFVIALVQLEEGPIFPTNIVDVEPEPKALKIGMPLTVVYHDITENISLPKFKPA